MKCQAKNDTVMSFFTLFFIKLTHFSLNLLTEYIIYDIQHKYFYGLGSILS